MTSHESNPESHLEVMFKKKTQYLAKHTSCLILQVLVIKSLFFRSNQGLVRACKILKDSLTRSC